MSKNQNFDPQAVKDALDESRIILVDVREPEEFALERIPGAVLCPLSGFDPLKLPQEDGRELVLHCKSGGRSGQALEACRKAGIKVAGHIEGGIMKWKSAGLPVDGASDQTGLSVSQAVMVTASTMVLVSMGLALTVNMLWLGLGAAASAMMIQAVFTGFCPAGRVFSALGFRPG